MILAIFLKNVEYILQTPEKTKKFMDYILLQYFKNITWIIDISQ